MPVTQVLVPGFEPGSKAREAFMMGRYTTRAERYLAESAPLFKEDDVNRSVFTFTSKLKVKMGY